MIKTFAQILISVLISVLLCACSKSSVSSEAAASSYMLLNVGDVRQLVYQNDSSTVRWNIVGTTKRKDGTDVFIGQYIPGTEPPDTAYYFLRDGYFLSTLLDTSANWGYNPTNPYWEQKLARLYPTNGEQWHIIVGENDSTSFVAAHFQEKKVLCGNFLDVYGFTYTYYSNGMLDTMLTPFYAPNIGFIGTDINRDLQPDVSASYLKVGGREMGSLWPAKNPSPAGTNAERIRRNRILRSIFGIR